MDKLASISPQMAASLAKTNNPPADLRAAADILGSEAGDTYTEMLDQERAKQLSEQMNLGIAEALVAQFGGRNTAGFGG